MSASSRYAGHMYIFFYACWRGGGGGGQRCIVCKKEQNPSIQIDVASL